MKIFLTGGNAEDEAAAKKIALKLVRDKEQSAWPNPSKWT